MKKMVAGWGTWRARRFRLGLVILVLLMSAVGVQVSVAPANATVYPLTTVTRCSASGHCARWVGGIETGVINGVYSVRARGKFYCYSGSGNQPCRTIWLVGIYLDVTEIIGGTAVGETEVHPGACDGNCRISGINTTTPWVQVAQAGPNWRIYQTSACANIMNSTGDGHWSECAVTDWTIV